MRILRISDRVLGEGRRQVTVRWEDAGRAAQEAVTEIRFSSSPQDDELVRWYLEDYAEYPDDESTAIAQRAETRLAATGAGLFEQIFGAGRPAAKFWTLAAAGPRGLADVRVEVEADPRDNPGVPWELLHEPGTAQPLVLAAGELVRTHAQAQRAAQLPGAPQGRMRVLLVICRPDGASDVPFRSVASRLVTSAGAVEGLDLDVLRPATFERLGEVLRAAAEAERPYHVVHFDGHGAFLDATTALAPSGAGSAGTGSGSGAGASSSSSVKYSVTGSARPGRHGYLLFEGVSEDDDERQLVDGGALATLLVANGVPVLVLNACRSAYSEPPSTPGPPGHDVDDVDDAVLAYGSLAQEVAHAGVPGVVAMRYTVYVVTAAQFVADLYRRLLAGGTLGEAATVARKALFAQPVRQIAGKPVSLQDWAVPTVYEAAPLTLFSGRREAPAITIGAGQSQQQSDQGVAVAVPRPPDVGFFGRDETILALDRAFDNHRIVLLHAYAGAGKSSTAAEFARWYQNTGALDYRPGVDTDAVGPVVWSSFEHYLPLPRLLDTVGALFAGLFEANGVHWDAIVDDAERRELIVQVLNIIPTLWIWDNVEPVTGFPTGSASAWTDKEQEALVDFLREVRDRTRAKVLLTSRRPETAWLTNVAVRVQLPPMPMRERRQLAEALAEHHGTRVKIDWLPLLRFTGGNPLTITIAVGQALHENALTEEALNGLIARIHSGRATLGGDDSAQGRDKSLAASLDYGFRTAFTPTEHARLAVLHLFRDTIDVDALRYMGDPDIAGEHAIPGLLGMTRDTGIDLLDRAAEIGLLTPYGGGYYGIHPALPWYFTTLYHQHHPTTNRADTPAEHAYLYAIAALGSYYWRQVQDGHADAVAGALGADENNLRHAFDLARTHHQTLPELGCLQGLRTLYRLNGRTTEWVRLVQQITTDYLDPTTNTPNPGQEAHYPLIMQYRVRVARDARDWPTATTLQTARTTWDRQQAHTALTTPDNDLTPNDRYHLRNLAGSLEDLAELLRQQDDPDCLPAYTEALDLVHRINDTPAEANLASSIGTAYLSVTALHDLDQAHTWHQKSLALEPEHNRLGRAASHGQLAAVAYQRFMAARASGADQTVQLTHLNEALTGYQRALTLTPPEHHEYLAIWLNQLGLIYTDGGDTSAALRHYQQSLTHQEARGNIYGAGETRYNIAVLYSGLGRHDDALIYARAAHANFSSVGPGAEDRVRLAADSITLLEQALQERRDQDEGVG